MENVSEKIQSTMKLKIESVINERYLETLNVKMKCLDSGDIEAVAICDLKISILKTIIKDVESVPLENYESQAA